MHACGDDEVGGLLALPVADTLKQAGAEEPARVDATVARAGKWAAQTPQMFRLGLLRVALAAAGPEVTDESSAVEALGHRPRWWRRASRTSSSPGRPTLRWPSACWPLGWRPRHDRTHEPQPRRCALAKAGTSTQLVEGRPLVLGGVTVPHSHGLLGHSDADALLHAITDALLGAAAWATSAGTFPTPTRRSAVPTRPVAGRGRAPRAARLSTSVNVDCDHRRPGAQAGAAHPGHA
jgi:2-C-methyl-D-erythritol 4-phosphate cytidylyltransferase/2-C-methyl-D-erythritol 2,4-cyclodiphosphate synthase